MTKKVDLTKHNPSMASPIFVLGAAHSGKSMLATNILDPDQPAVVLGTANADEPALQNRLTELKKARASLWQSRDVSLDLPEILPGILAEYPQVIIDSVNQWVGRILADGCSKYTPAQQQDLLYTDTDMLLKTLKTATTGAKVVVVGAELSACPPSAQPLDRFFRQVNGLINQRIAAVCPTVMTVHAGIPLVIKGGATVF